PLTWRAHGDAQSRPASGRPPASPLLPLAAGMGEGGPTLPRARGEDRRAHVPCPRLLHGPGAVLSRSVRQPGRGPRADLDGGDAPPVARGHRRRRQPALKVTALEPDTPVPAPNSTLPLESWSSVARSWASRTGWWKGSWEIMRPNRR